MNSFSPSERMSAIKMPPIAEIMARVSELKSSGRRIYNMAQAVGSILRMCYLTSTHFDICTSCSVLSITI